MLGKHLAEYWEVVRNDPLLRRSDLLKRFVDQASSQGLFDYVVSADGRQTVRALMACFKPGPGQSAASISRQGYAFDAILLMALTAIECWLEADSDVRGIVEAAHEPVAGEDPLMVCILAAVAFRFGLRFKAGNVLPINVMDKRLPLPELNNPGEDGLLLIGGEILGKYHRDIYDIDAEFDRAPDIDTLRDSIEELNREFGCSLVVAAPSVGRLKDVAARKAMHADLRALGARIYYRPEPGGVAPAAVRGLLNNLKFHLAPLLGVNKKKEESKMEDKKPEGPVQQIGTQINIDGGQVALAAAPHSQAAFGNIINGASVQDIAGMLSSLQAVIDAHPSLSGDKRELLQLQLETIREKATREPRSDSDAPLVKKYLNGLKQGAEAVTNGSTIIEKLTPLAEGLAKGWPALAVLLGLS